MKAAIMYPDSPLTYQEMMSLIPEEVKQKDHPHGFQIVATIRAVDMQLTQCRILSKKPVNESEYHVDCSAIPKMIRVQRIQDQMRAIRFRLRFRDYAGDLERVILEDRLKALYAHAKSINPDMVAKFEHSVDKKISKGKLPGRQGEVKLFYEPY